MKVNESEPVGEESSLLFLPKTCYLSKILRKSKISKPVTILGARCLLGISLGVSYPMVRMVSGNKLSYVGVSLVQVVLPEGVLSSSGSPL